MGLTEFEVYFDNPSSIYHPGETLTGKVVLAINSPKTIRGIRLSIKGTCKTTWSERVEQRNQDGQNTYKNEQFTAKEQYFKNKYYILGSEAGRQIELPMGSYTYPFHCVLPKYLPSSFESTYGNILYTVKATLDRPWKFNQDTKSTFTVNSPVDLNKMSEASHPIAFEMSKTFGLLCCASQPLSVNISVPVTGFVPGQSIPVKVDVENESGVLIEEVQLNLIRTTTYKSTYPKSDTKIVKDIISTVVKGPIRGNETKSYMQDLLIPLSTYPVLQHCGIIDLKYKLHAEACASGCCRGNLDDTCPIIIGTVPLSNYHQLTHQSNEFHNKTTLPLNQPNPNYPMPTPMPMPMPLPLNGSTILYPEPLINLNDNNMMSSNFNPSAPPEQPPSYDSLCANNASNLKKM